MRRTRWCSLGVAIAALGVTLALSTTGASAAAGTTAVGTFTGTVYLPTYPCSGGGCGGGTLAGLFTGTASGSDPSSCRVGPPVQCNTYEVTWPDPTQSLPTSNLIASFTYSEGCPVAQGGTASGSFSISGGLVVDNGTITHDGTLSGSFGYSRTGLTFTVLLSATTVSGDGHVLGTQQLLVGAGGGAFVPLNIATCGSSPSATAEVAGTAFIPG